MKHLWIYLSVSIIFMFVSCSDFLDTSPHDALSPATTWKTEADVENFVVGCYNGLWKSDWILYLDCGSDIAYNNFVHEGFRTWGDGSLSPSGKSTSFYNFTTIRRCNIVLDNIDKVEFTTSGKKEDLIAQVKAIRAFCYFRMNWWYGGVPIIESYFSAEEAKVPRETEDKVRQYIVQDLNDALAGIKEVPSERGRIARGTVLAIKMREALYYGEWEVAMKTAQAIMDLKQYELEPVYSNLFKTSGIDSKEIIVSDQHIVNIYAFSTIGQMYNNKDGGWSSIVPTQNLVDMYEMENGLTKDEAGSGYDAEHPFANRDPRMEMSILYPGRDWRGEVLNTLDTKLPNGFKNLNYPLVANNASKTALTWAKYLDPFDQYVDMWDTDACVIVFRYAEVLLTYAEAANELDGPSNKVYDCLNQIRTRAGMPEVDRTKYGTKETLRELIRRERCVEFAGEGLRRADILRWKDDSGKMLAETLLNGELTRIVGTIDYNENDPHKRAVITGTELIEERCFKPYNRYLPIQQNSIDKNPKLEQNPGYY